MTNLKFHWGKQWFATLSQVIDFHNKVWRRVKYNLRKNYRKNHWEDLSNLHSSCEISQAVLSFAQSFINLKKSLRKKIKAEMVMYHQRKKIIWHTLFLCNIVSRYDRTSSIPQRCYDNRKASFRLFHISSP